MEWADPIRPLLLGIPKVSREDQKAGAITAVLFNAAFTLQWYRGVSAENGPTQRGLSAEERRMAKTSEPQKAQGVTRTRAERHRYAPHCC